MRLVYIRSARKDPAVRLRQPGRRCVVARMRPELTSLVDRQASEADLKKAYRVCLYSLSFYPLSPPTPIPPDPIPSSTCRQNLLDLHLYPIPPPGEECPPLSLPHQCAPPMGRFEVAVAKRTTELTTPSSGYPRNITPTSTRTKRHTKSLSKCRKRTKC